MPCTAGFPTRMPYLTCRVPTWTMLTPVYWWNGFVSITTPWTFFSLVPWPFSIIISIPWCSFAIIMALVPRWQIRSGISPRIRRRSPWVLFTLLSNQSPWIRFCLSIWRYRAPRVLFRVAATKQSPRVFFIHHIPIVFVFIPHIRGTPGVCFTLLANTVSPGSFHVTISFTWSLVYLPGWPLLSHFA